MGTNSFINPNALFFKGYMSALINPLLCFKVQIAKLSWLCFFIGHISAVLILMCFVFQGNKLALSSQCSVFLKGYISCINPLFITIFYKKDLLFYYYKYLIILSKPQYPHLVIFHFYFN